MNRLIPALTAAILDSTATPVRAQAHSNIRGTVTGFDGEPTQ